MAPLLGDGALGLPEADHRDDHRAEHDDADGDANPEREHVQAIHLPRSLGHARRQVELPRLGIGKGHAAGEQRENREQAADVRNPTSNHCVTLIDYRINYRFWGVRP